MKLLLKKATCSVLSGLFLRKDFVCEPELFGTRACYILQIVYYIRRLYHKLTCSCSCRIPSQWWSSSCQGRSRMHCIKCCLKTATFLLLTSCWVNYVSKPCTCLCINRRFWTVPICPCATVYIAPYLLHTLRHTSSSSSSTSSSCSSSSSSSSKLIFVGSQPCQAVVLVVAVVAAAVVVVVLVVTEAVAVVIVQCSSDSSST